MAGPADYEAGRTAAGFQPDAACQCGHVGSVWVLLGKAAALPKALTATYPPGCTATNPPAHTQPFWPHSSRCRLPQAPSSPMVRCGASREQRRQTLRRRACFRPEAGLPQRPRLALQCTPPPHPAPPPNPLRPVLLHCSNARWRGHQPAADGRQRVPEARQRAAAHPTRPCGQQQRQQRAAAMRHGSRPMRRPLPLRAPRCTAPLGLQSGMNS